MNVERNRITMVVVLEEGREEMMNTVAKWSRNAVISVASSFLLLFYDFD